MVGEGGLEPPCPYGHTDLNRARLPIPPLARTGQPRYQRALPSHGLRPVPFGAVILRGYDRSSAGKGRFVGVLQRFERRLGGLVEGAFAKVFKGDVQPVEVAGALQRETDDKKTIVGQGKVLVPNDFVVELGQHDYGRLSPWEEPLGKELAAMVREHAAEQRYSFVGPVKVALELMPAVDTGTFRIRSGVSAGDLVDGSRVVHASSPASDVAGAGGVPLDALPRHPRLVVSSGGKASAGSPEARGEEQTYFLTRPVTVIGRAADADLRVNDPGVSRKHAEIRLQDDELSIADLGSTNGLRLNDAPITRQRLLNGDRIELGSTTLVFRRDED